MRFPSLPVLIAISASFAIPHAIVAQQATPPVDAAAVLTALKDIKAKQVDVVAREKGQVLDAIRAALADPVKTYEQAVVSVQFQGKGNEGARLIEWRRDNGDLLRDKGFANALRLQLAYISLTWQRYMGAKSKDQLPALYDYTSQVIVNFDALWTLKMTDKSLVDNVFVTYFQIGPFISGLADWEMQPFNVDGIFQKMILPELRKEKDPRLLAYWDNKIQTEASKFDQRSNGLAVNRFNMVRRPTLLWNRAEDELVLGDTGRAVADMLAIIRTHPDHPDFDKWTTRLTEVVSPKAEVIVRDAPVGSPVPGTGQ